MKLATPPSEPSCARRKQASWQPAVQEGRQIEGLKLVICWIEGLKLVSRQFRKQRLAFWAAGRRLDPSFTAMVFWLCDTALGPEVCQTKASKLAVSSAGRQANRRFEAGYLLCWIEDLKLVSTQFRKQRLALWAAVTAMVKQIEGLKLVLD